MSLVDQHINALQDKLNRIAELLDILSAMGETDDIELLGHTVNTSNFRAILNEAAEKQVEEAYMRLSCLEAAIRIPENFPQAEEAGS